MSRTQDYFETFVVRNFRAFTNVQAELVAAVNEADAELLKEARTAALVAGMNAAVPAYHLTDVAVVDRPVWVPPNIGTGKGAAKKLVEFLETKHCFMLRSAYQVADLTQLGDIVDAYKHAELN